MDLLFHASVFSVFKHIPLQVSTYFVHISVDMDRHVITFAGNNRFGLGGNKVQKHSSRQKLEASRAVIPTTARRLSVASV
jgi:hypothetical protein